MSEKRRDNKGRVLWTGESQRKEGRYAYKYVDTFGQPQFVYAWKLVSTDRTPKGKRDDISLREKEKSIKRDIDDGVNFLGRKMTLCQLYEKHISHRTNVKRNTEIGRKHLMSTLEKDKLGHRTIDKIKMSDGKEWAIRMKEKGYSYNTIENYKRSLIASFYMAIEDDSVRKNPFTFPLNKVLVNDTKAKVVLSEQQEAELLQFIENDYRLQKYYDEVVLLLRTGLRISEFCGLIPKNLDFKNRLINVDHQLIRDTKGYYIETPKTDSGVRKVPMSESVYQILRKYVKKQKEDTSEKFEVDGYSGFLFHNNKGRPRLSCDYQYIFTRVVHYYNEKHDHHLPNITPHMLRHTFCTRLANAGMNPKALQYMMGHKDISTTLNLYTHASLETVKFEVERLIL